MRPEVGVRFSCARLAYRRAREQRAGLRGDHGAAPRGRAVFRRARAMLLTRDWQGKPVIGPIVRTIAGWVP